MYLLFFILSQLLFVTVGRQITACCKQAVYKIPVIKSMIDASPVDAIFLNIMMSFVAILLYLIYDEFPSTATNIVAGEG